jgi:hypothetical protein
MNVSLLNHKPLYLSPSYCFGSCRSVSESNRYLYDITVTATGFSAALQYSADGSNYQTGNVITVNAPGTYTISVKDANGCITTAPVTIGPINFDTNSYYFTFL